MSPILITGGAGFLGGWLLKALAAKGQSVRVFDRTDNRAVLRSIAGPLADEVQWVTGDVTDTAAVKAAAQGCAAIIHLAALLTPACKADPILGAQVNLIGTLNVFEAAKAHGLKRVVYASSAAVFGPDDGLMPLPVTQYGVFKLACEGSARAYWHDCGLASIGFRPTIVYGPGRESGLTADVTLACREAVAGRAYTIGFSGAQDFVYVADAAAAFAAAALADYDGAHAFSLIGGTADVGEVAAAIRTEVPGAALTIDGPPVPMAPVIAETPYTPLLGPLPRTPLAQGIAQTVAFYRAASGATHDPPARDNAGSCRSCWQGAA